MKIRGNTVGTTIPKPNLEETNPKKGSYVFGKELFLKVSQLNDGIKTALAQAKASGEFDGPKGEKGDPGEPGTPGEKGDPGPAGATGKTAYEYAMEGGFTGSEEEFAKLMYSGSGNADWTQNDSSAPGYVKNRTHNVEGVRTEVLPELTWADEDGWVMESENNLGLQLGEVYAVNWNGREYLREAKRYVTESAVFIYLGNDDFWGLPSTGEPFCITDELGVDWSMIVACGEEPETEGTVKIDHMEIVVHKLDDMYIDADWLAKRLATEVDVIPDTVCQFTGYSKQLEAVNQELIKDGETYSVYWNGKKYTSYGVVKESELDGTLYMIGNGKLMGNLGLTSNYPNTGEPFLILSFVGTAYNFFAIKDTDTQEAVTLRVTGKEYTYNTIPEGYLPGSVPVIQKAQVGQIVAVKAVDENGNPTEWEAVDRTHWVEGGGYVLEEITLTASEDTDGMMLIPGYVPLENGKVYTVNYNGVAYECQAVELTEDDMTGIYLGNLSALTGTGNAGEPFVMMAWPSEEVVAEAGYGGIVADVTGATSATISIGGETVHKLDNKFLDLDWLPTREETYIEMIPETSFAGGETVYDVDGTAISEHFVPQLTEPGVVLEGTAKVVYDGTVYNCPYISGRDTADLYFFINYPPAGALPFSIFTWLDGTATVGFYNADGTPNTDHHTLSMSIFTGTKYNTIPVEFLPEMEVITDEELAELMAALEVEE